MIIFFYQKLILSIMKQTAYAACLSCIFLSILTHCVDVAKKRLQLEFSMVIFANGSILLATCDDID